jgi:hypothetical protein
MGTPGRILTEMYELITMASAGLKPELPPDSRGVGALRRSYAEEESNAYAS